MSKALWLLAGLAVLALVAGLGGCGGGDEVSGTGVDTAGKPPPPPPPFPGGYKIAFCRLDSKVWNVYTVSADGTALTKLALGDCPTWSPDGNWLAFTVPVAIAGGTTRCVYVINRNGTGLRRVTEPVPYKGGTSADTDPDWSPDGSSIVFARGTRYGSGDALYTVPFVGDTPVLLFDSADSETSPFPFDNDVYMPRWSPDGAYVGFMQWSVNNPPSPPNQWLRVLKVATGDVYDLHEGAREWCWYPTASPYRICLRSVAAGTAGVCTATFTGTALADLTVIAPTSGGTKWSPSWSADRRIAVSAYVPGTDLLDILTMNESGTVLKNVTNTSRNTEIRPDFSPYLPPG